MISAAHMLRGMLPCGKLFKMCNLMRLGEYFEQILYYNCFPMNKHEI